MSYDPKASMIAQTFDLKPLLRQRGLSLDSEMRLEDTLYPLFAKTAKINRNDFYKLMSDNEERKRIRRSIFGQDKCFLLRGHAITLDKTNELNFTKSFEWYVSQLLLTEFSFFTVGYGVKTEDTPQGSDFDVLGFGLDLFVHVECKTGSPKNICKNHVVEFKSRTDFIGADINIFYIDYNGLSGDSAALLDDFNQVFLEDRVYKITKPQSGFEIYQVGVAPTFVIDTNKSSKRLMRPLNCT